MSSLLFRSRSNLPTSNPGSLGPHRSITEGTFIMAFSKNWKQLVVSKGEPFQIEYLDRKFGGRPEVVFEVTEDGVVQVNGQVMDGDQNITGSLTASTTITAADLVATDDLTVGGDAAITGALTTDDLEATGTVDLSAATVTLPDDSVTAAQLEAALTAQIPMTAELTVGALVGDGREVTIQVLDANGVAMALAGRYSVWLSDTSKGSPIGQVTTGLTTTITDGVLALTKLANMDFEILSNADGTLAVTVTDTNGTQTRYLMISVNGAIYASAAIVNT